MATIHELPQKATAEIPPELANLTRADLQEYMLGTMRESLFLTFEASPECVGITLRREIAGRYWDITIQRLAYATTADPHQVRRLRRDDLRDGCEATELFSWLAQVMTLAVDGDRFDDWDRPEAEEVFATPEEAYADAKAYLAANGERLVAQRANEDEYEALS